MKLIKNLNPKQIFRSRKSRSVSRSDSQFLSSGSGSSSDSSSTTNLKGPSTPTSVLLTKSMEISSADLSDFSSDIHYELVEAFKRLDKDGDGRIMVGELETLLSRVVAERPSEKEIMLMLSDVDCEGDGSVSLEALGAISSSFGPPGGSELREAFDIFDTDRDGMISAEELLQVFMSIGDEQCTLEDCRRMISGVDSDGDGFVCFEDFSRMMMTEQRR